MAILALVAIVCWCSITGRTSVDTWQVPLEYGQKGADGDATAVLANIKAASEGEFPPFLVKNFSRVGAPYHGNWSDIPNPEGWQYFLPGLLARFTGLFAAANFAVLLAQVLACICFYIVARLLNCKWWWAFAGGLAFGFAQFALARSLHHLNVTNYWYIPFCLLIAEWITRNEMGEYRGRRYIFAIIASFVIGMQSPYYTNMFLQLTLLGAFYQYFRQGWKPVLQAGGIVGASAVGFLLMNVNTMYYHFTHGPNSGGLVREFKWLELSALKFVDLLIPPQDHPLFGGIGQAYYGEAGRAYDPAAVKMVAFPSEVPPSCYLGILGIACLVWLAVIAIRRLLKEPGRNLPLEAWQVLWVLAFSVVGGLNCLAGIVGVQLFRSTTRYCIFILPILLLFAIRRLSKKQIPTEVGIVLAGICALVALWDQTPPTAEMETGITETRRVVDSDRKFTQKIETALPKGAMIFQIPIMEFPESPAPNMPSYDHFRPYLHSEHLRVSFGAIKGRPWTNWQKDFGQSMFQNMQGFKGGIQTLESYGFAAIYINRNGLPEKGEGLLKIFRDLGYGDMIQSDFGDLVCVLLHPHPHPSLPAGSVD